MDQVISPIPQGFHTITPFMIVDNAHKALKFYQDAFDAQVIKAFVINENEIIHAQLKVGDSIIMLAQKHPDMAISEQNGTHHPISFMVYVENVDVLFKHLKKFDIQIIQDITDQFYGDRTATILDPYGHIWTVGSRIENITDNDLKKRIQTLLH